MDRLHRNTWRGKDSPNRLSCLPLKFLGRISSIHLVGIVGGRSFVQRFSVFLARCQHLHITCRCYLLCLMAVSEGRDRKSSKVLRKQALMLALSPAMLVTSLSWLLWLPRQICTYNINNKTWFTQTICYLNALTKRFLCLSYHHSCLHLYTFVFFPLHLRLKVLLTKEILEYIWNVSSLNVHHRH